MQTVTVVKTVEALVICVVLLFTAFHLIYGLVVGVYSSVFLGEKVPTWAASLLLGMLMLIALAIAGYSRKRQ